MMDSLLFVMNQSTVKIQVMLLVETLKTPHYHLSSGLFFSSNGLHLELFKNLNQI